MDGLVLHYLPSIRVIAISTAPHRPITRPCRPPTPTRAAAKEDRGPAWTKQSVGNGPALFPVRWYHELMNRIRVVGNRCRLSRGNLFAPAPSILARLSGARECHIAHTARALVRMRLRLPTPIRFSQSALSAGRPQLHTDPGRLGVILTAKTHFPAVTSPH